MEQTLIKPGGANENWKVVFVVWTVLVAGQADPDAVGDLDEPVTTAITERGDAPRFYVTDDPDHGLGRRLLGEALVSFVAGAILLAIAYFLVAA